MKLKKIGTYFLASLLAVSSIGISSPNLEVKASENGVTVSEEGNKITIGNDFIEREFSIENKKVKTNKIVNKRTGNEDTVFIPAKGSEEFIIKTTKERREPISLEAINRDGWTAEADSYQNATGAGDGPAKNLLDGDVNSIWHSKYNASGAAGQMQYPYHVLFDLNGAKTFQSFSYTPRKEGENTNGNILGYELYGANIETDLNIESAEWKLLSKGNFAYDGVNPIYVNLEKETTANQLKFVAVSAKNGLQFAGGAEFNLHKDKAPVVSDDRSFATSDLELASYKSEATSATINGVEKEGQKVSFTFKPYTHKGVDYTITENVVMYNGDHFMRKYMEISIPEGQKKNAEIDYIDMESLKVNESDVTWTIPTDAGGVVAMDRFKANLGQPIYIQGMFFGSEFPVADTQIVDKTGYMRYYSGKTFERLVTDEQAGLDGQGNVVYNTWQTVAGAARSTENAVIQSDFFDYIDSIATPSEFRIQYNSWFDNMMLIDDKNILESFIEVDKEFNATETRPMDSYVVDDGWNNYNNTRVVDADRSGTSLNTSGFWEFNTKFPNGLTPSSELVQKFGSNFGVWIGPRGGYNFFGDLANILTKSGKGSKAGGSVDVADRTYVENFRDMAVKWQKEYGVNYWKWDGYADGGQYNHFPASDGVPGYANRHMTGGYQHMYHVTDLWEAWIDLFEDVRQSEKDDNINKLWISLTCYVNPSPWYLQWANSVWMQCVGDRGESGSINGKMDKMLTYRDAMYYDFITAHEFQFPLKAIYNHDPIYGKEGTGININSMTDEEFKNYLYIQAGRGTGFWELYYSDSLMTPGKYEVNAEFLEWAEKNFHILQNSKMIGGNPARNVTLSSGPLTVGNGGDAYAFSAWDNEDGIIAMRNSDTSPKQLSFVLDRNIGASESIEGKTLYRTTAHSFNTPDGADSAYKELHYGDTVTLTLQPGEVRIWEVSTTKDTTAPKYTRAYSDGNKTVTVKFNEKVSGSLFDVEGAEVASIQKSADDITYHITLTKALADGQEVRVTASDIKDMAGNKVKDTAITFTNHKGNVILDETISDTRTFDKALNSNNGFTVSAETNATGKTVLAKQDGGYELGINEQGKAYFTLNGATAVSDKALTAKAEGTHVITGVKENNGMLKLYVDGELSGSAYKKENRYFEVKGSATVVGESVSEIKVFDRFYGYDEVSELVNPSEEERTPLPTGAMSVEVSGTSEGNKSNVFDNDPTTFWTSAKKADGIAKGNPYLTVDLGDTYMIDRFDYTKRYYNGPQNQWKCTGNLRKYVLEVSMDGTTWTEVKAGETFADENYNEKGDGGTTQITFNPTLAKYVRISGTESYHWEPENVNKFMTVGDVNIYGEKATENIALDKTAVTRWKANDEEFVKSDRPASMAVDGTKNNVNGNYAEFGTDARDESSYLQVDLGDVCDVESINMYRYWVNGRIYKNTVIALSESEDFSNPVIVYNTDTNNVHGFGNGSDQTYAETANGHTFNLEKTTKARYVRVYMNGTTSGGKTNHINELEVMGRMPKQEVESVNITALINRLKELNTALENADATKASEVEFKALVNAGYDLIANGADTQAEVDAMIESLKDAENVLVDVSVLRAAEKEAREAVTTSTTSSAEAMNALLEKAEALYENGTADKIAELAKAIKDEMKNLVARGDTSELAELIASYKDLVEADYTKDSWTKFKSALDAAQAIVDDNSDSDAAAVESAKDVLTKAHDALEKAPVIPDVDKDALKAALDAAKDVLANKDAYTTSSYEAYKAVYDEAKGIYESESATQEQVNAATDKLTAAKKPVNRASVEEAKKLLETLEDKKEADYTEESWKVFAEAKEALVQAVKDNSDVNEEEMNALMGALVKANKALEEKPTQPQPPVVDKQELENLYNEYKDKKNENYTEASWKAFQTALEAAKAILDYPEATQAQVNSAKTSLQKAISGLQKVSTGNGTETGDATNVAGLLALLGLAGAAIAYTTRKKVR